MNILSVFQEHALNNGNIALKCYDREISFSDLYIISNSISKDLVHKNIIGDIIGIYDNGSIEHFLLMLACMQANIPFINLDVKAPINYIKNIVEKLNIKTIYTKDNNAKLKQICDNVFSIRSLKSYRQTQNIKGKEIKFGIENIHDDSQVCYYITTSGSTGEPKIVRKKLGQLNFSYRQFKDELPFLSGEIVQQYAPLCFAFSLDQSLIFLCAGSTICIDDIDKNINFKKICTQINKNASTGVFLGAPILKLLSRQPQLIEYIPDCVRYIVSGGERLNLGAALLLLFRTKNIDLFNNYGCTELGTIFFHRVEIGLNEIQQYNRIPIGHPLKGFKVLLQGGSKVNSGTLWVEAEKLYNDYYNSVNNNVKYLDGKTVFNTHDIVEFKNHQYYIVGREDNVVNINGYRISIEYIEEKISMLIDSNECCIVPINDKNDSTSIFCVYSYDKVSAENIYKKLCKIVPRYMLPKEIFYIKEIPHLKNNKIDRLSCKEAVSALLHTDVTEEKKDVSSVIRNKIEEIRKIKLQDNYRNLLLKHVGFDSLAFADLFCTLEYYFNIPFDDQLLIEKKIITIGDLIDFVSEQVREHNEKNR